MLQNQLISVAWPRIGFESNAVLVKEAFQSGVLELRDISCGTGFATAFASTPLQMSSCFMHSVRPSLSSNANPGISVKNWLQLTAYSDVGHNQNWDPGTKITFLCGKA